MYKKIKTAKFHFKVSKCTKKIKWVFVNGGVGLFSGIIFHFFLPRYLAKGWFEKDNGGYNIRNGDGFWKQLQRVSFLSEEE